jgi:hemerythrin
MALISWSNALSTGIAEQDCQHRQLIDIVNRLNDAMQAGKSHEVMGQVLTDLVEYTVYHFSLEEALMSRHHYEGLTAHKDEHDKFIRAVKNFRHEFEIGTGVVSVDLVGFLREWVSYHIMITDKRMGQTLAKSGANEV